MGSTVDKFMNFMKLDNKDEEDYDEDYGYDDDEEETRPAKSSDDSADKAKKSSKGMFKGQDKDSRRKNMSANINAGVCMRFPKQLNDAAEVVDDLKSMNSVVLNLDGIAQPTAQSIYDFLCGASYALGCRMEKVSECVYVITPESVTLSGDLLAPGDGSGLY